MAKRTRKSKLPLFNMYTWSSTIPLADELWLGMQSRNLAMVDMGLLRPMEAESLALYFAHMKTPAMELTFQSAVSQMWIFALYEFLRTWRERSSHLIKLADEYKTVHPRKKVKFVADAVAVAAGKEKHVKIAMTFGSHTVGMIANDAFMNRIRDYHSKISPLFTEIEGLRVTLAKHEIPSTRGFVAEAPGYARMNCENGALYWHYSNKDGAVEQVDRRDVSDRFFDIDTLFSPQPIKN